MRIYKKSDYPRDLFSIYVLQRSGLFHLILNGNIVDSSENEDEIMDIENGVIYHLKEDGYKIA